MWSLESLVCSLSIEGSGAKPMVKDVASENEQQSSHPQSVPAEQNKFW